MEIRAASAGAVEATAAGRFASRNHHAAPPIRTSNAAIPTASGSSAERFFDGTGVTGSAGFAGFAWAGTSRYGARDLFEQALTLDPTNADALAGAAFVDMTDFTYGWSDQQELNARAMQRANQALLLNPDQPYAHYTKATLIMLKAKPNDPASANEIISEAEASLRADPSFARAYFPMAVGEGFLGHHEQSISDLEQAMRISPRDSYIGLWHMEMGRQLLARQRDSQEEPQHANFAKCS